MRIVVMGAGAMGSAFGAYLALGGHDVTLVDIRRECVDAIASQGGWSWSGPTVTSAWSRCELRRAPRTSVHSTS